MRTPPMSSTPRPLPRHSLGLTLIELMVTLSILAILAAIATPSFRQTIASSRLTSATNELMNSLTRTRAESIRLGTRVTACKSDGSSTACSASTTVGWENGWVVFQDPTRSSTTVTIDAAETVTFVAQPMPAGIKALGDTKLADYLSYSSDGRPRLYTGVLPAAGARIRVCSDSTALTNDTRAREIVLLTTGRLVVEKVAGIASSCPAP
jgi:type IV fimbrial biogenesis protein FimT